MITLARVLHLSFRYLKRRHFFPSALSAVLLLILCSGSLAQFPDMNEKLLWAHFSASSGLPAGEITTLFESSDSTLWVSTLTGVAWFDGYRWREGESGALWPRPGAYTIVGEYCDSVLIFSAGSCYLGNSHGFRELGREITQNLFLKGKDTVSLSYDRTLLREYRKSMVPKADARTERSIMHLFTMKSGSVWLMLPDGLYRPAGPAWKCQLSSAAGRMALDVLAIDENHHGTGICVVRNPEDKMGIWEWTKDGSVHRSSLATSNFYIVSADIDENDNVVAVDRAGEIVTRHNGIWKVIPFLPENGTTITRVLFRQNGDLCLGGDDGIYVWRHDSNRWTSLPLASDELKNCINEIFKSRIGDIWIASASGLEIRHHNGKVEEITSLGKEPLLNVTGVEQDGQGNMWISSGSAFSGVFEWDGRTWKHLPVGRYANDVYVHKIRRDLRGRLWFLGLGQNPGTSDDDESGAFCLENGVFSRWSVPEGLLGGRVYAFQEGRDSSFWFGTHKGICRYHAGRWTYWTRANGLRQDHIFCLALDHDDNVWFGHMTTDGLGRIDGTGQIRYFGIEDGLPDNRIYDVRVDSTGIVWVTTRGGLCCYDQGKWSTFDEKSGLVSNALWPVLPTNDGVYVGTTGKGVAILNPDAREDRYPSIVIDTPLVENQNAFIRWHAFAYNGEVSPENSLTRYRLNNGNWSAWSTLHEVSLRSASTGTSTVDVQAKGLYGQFSSVPARASFTILPVLYLRPIIYLPAIGALTALVYLLVIVQVRRRKHRHELEKSEERYRLITELMSDYAYLLAIHEDGSSTVLWITESFERLTGYAMGAFKERGFAERFNHRDDNSSVAQMLHSVRNGKPESFESRIVTRAGNVLWIHHDVAPIWNASHTRVTHIYGIARDITQRKQNEEQMRKLATELSLTEERERRRMATFLHDTIGQTLAFSKIKLRTLERSTGDKKTLHALSEIRALIEESIIDTRSLTFELSPPALHELGIAEAIRSLATQLFERHDIGFEFTGEQLPAQPADEMSVILYYATREVLINIVKHSRARWVSLSMASCDGSIVVSVQDNGIGMKDAPGNGAGGRKDSFGLFNTRERLLHVGGGLTIQSAPNEGTMVVLTVPLKTAASQSTS